MLGLYLQTLKNQTESKMDTKTTLGLDAASVRFFTKVIENYAESDHEGCTLQPLLSAFGQAKEVRWIWKVFKQIHFVQLHTRSYGKQNTLLSQYTWMRGRDLKSVFEAICFLIFLFL